MRYDAAEGGAKVYRYGPSGQLDQVVDLPVSNVTACAFGGDDMTTLYMTTSRMGIPDGAEPEAGAAFSFDASVAGLPIGAYAG